MENIWNFIDGEFIAPASEQYIDDINPATGELIGKIASSESQDVQNAVDAATKALKSWSALTIEQRITWLEKIADALESKEELIAQTESKDTGKGKGRRRYVRRDENHHRKLDELKPGKTGGVDEI